jgi:hypothetical protein
VSEPADRRPARGDTQRSGSGQRCGARGHVPWPRIVRLRMWMRALQGRPPVPCAAAYCVITSCAITFSSTIRSGSCRI